MLIKLEDQSPVSGLGNQHDYYSIANGVKANRFIWKQDIPDKFTKCFTYIGGFVDSTYFVKSEINRLSHSDMIEFSAYVQDSNNYVN